MTPRDMWRQIREVKAGSALVISLVFSGVLVGLTAGGWIGLPERVQAVERTNARQDSVIAAARRDDLEDGRKLDRVLCLVEAMAAGQDPVARGCAR